jgi:hypothetical protein
MKCSGLWLSLLLTSPLSTGAHATNTVAGGTISFHGVILQSTATPSPTRTYNATKLPVATTTLPLGKARQLLSSDVLDFFATYAPADAKFVSVAYP